MTTWGKEGETLILDADPKNHPAWRADGKSTVDVNNERISRFNAKFGNY